MWGGISLPDQFLVAFWETSEGVRLKGFPKLFISMW